MISYRSVEIDGTDRFYREVGDPAAPALLLLHGFPSSSAQYQTLRSFIVAGTAFSRSAWAAS
jgi:pimeloyl-ACP methyl ester carboxylesterase